MRIVLNDKLTPTASRSLRADYLVEELKRKLASLSSTNSYALVGAPDVGEADLHTNYLSMVSAAYSGHHSVRIAPHDLWYIVMCEIAESVNRFPDEFRELFTTSGEKQDILVPTDDIEALPLDLIMGELRRKVPSDVDKFMPEFSTLTEETRLAFYAAFADTVKSYYSYMTFCCGLPSVEITGTTADWGMFGQNLNDLSLLLKPITDKLKHSKEYSPVSSRYFDGAREMIEKLGDLKAGRGDDDFVKDFYSHRNVGSGGEKDMTGWLAKFFTSKSVRLDSFNPCISVVPFKNIETQREFSLVYGSFWNTIEDGFRVARYGGLTFEHRLPKMKSSGIKTYTAPQSEPEGRWTFERETANV